MEKIIIQIIGAIGYFLLALSYYKTNKIKIIFTQIFAYIFFTIHYYLLDAYTGALCNGLSLIVIIIIYLMSKNDNNKYQSLLKYLIIPFVILIAYISYENIYSIFPVISSLIALPSLLSKEEKTIRKIGVISAICWLIYAIIYKSYVAICFEVITIISVFIALLKVKKK